MSKSKLRSILMGAMGMSLGALVVYAAEGRKWEVHDMKRPKPAIITPGTESSQEQPGKPPSDALVLFDGKDLSHWQNHGKPAEWIVENGYMQTSKASIQTKESFGNVQLHVEWMEPPVPEVKPPTSQGRGNSGVLFMDGRYEVQVLDSYNNETYADGQCGAVYGQHPPLVNACRPPQTWQTYDIIFHPPQWDGDKLTSPGSVTVLQNGVLVQDHWIYQGKTAHHQIPKFEPHANKLPFELQFHGNTVRYRNIWVRELDGYQQASDAQPKD
jgi:hypothetical protein